MSKSLKKSAPCDKRFPFSIRSFSCKTTISIARRCHKACLDGVQYNVASEFHKVVVLVDHIGLETALEKMPRPIVAAAEELGVRAVELPHAC